METPTLPYARVKVTVDLPCCATSADWATSRPVVDDIDELLHFRCDVCGKLWDYAIQADLREVD